MTFALNRKLIRRSIGTTILAINIAYATGTYFGLWDEWSGRKDLESVYEQLSSTKGLPNVALSASDPRFKAVYKFALEYSVNDTLQQMHREGKDPAFIMRFGGAFKPDLGDPYPGWPTFDYALPTSPVVAVWNYSEADLKSLAPMSREQIKLVSTIRELLDWTRRSRSTEQYWIVSILVGLLSALVIFLDWKS
jgi:hypothetical protein